MATGETTPKTVNQQLLAQLQVRLEEVDDETLKRGGDKAAAGESLVGIKGLFGFFQDKFNLPDTHYVEDDRKDLYDVFEDSVLNSLITTKKTGVYEDFADITVLYFIRDADRARYSVEEIEEFLQLI